MSSTLCGINAIEIDGQCVCNYGWFVLKDFGFDQDGNSCRGNIVVIRVMYSMICVLFVSTLVALLSLIKRRSQLVRFIPGLIAYISFSVFSFLKATFPDTVFFGDSVPFTLALLFAFVGHAWNAITLLDKYVLFLISIENFSALFGLKSDRQTTIFLRRVTKISILCVIPPVVASLFLDSDGDIIASRITFSATAIAHGLLCLSYLRVQFRVNKIFRSFDSLPQGTNDTDLFRARDDINRFLTTVNIGLMIHNIFFALPGFISEQSLKILIYIIPVACLNFVFYPLIATINQTKSIKKLKRVRNRASKA